MVSFKIVSVGSYCVNCVVVSESGRCLVVDPGQDADVIADCIKSQNLTPVAVLLTHGHFDHVGGIPGLLERYQGLPVYAHPSDWPMFGHPLNRCPPDYPGVPRPADLRDVRTAESDFAEFGMSVMETPGHTPGSVCLRFGNTLLSGDTLFAGSCGRTDFPGGSMAAMRSSLSALSALPPEVAVIPGHGASTTIGREIEFNPFIV